MIFYDNAVTHFHFFLYRKVFLFTLTMDLKIIFLFAAGIVMLAAANADPTTDAHVKAEPNKTNIEDNELDNDDYFEPEERITYGYRWYRYRRPVDLQIRVP